MPCTFRVAARYLPYRSLRRGDMVKKAAEAVEDGSTPLRCPSLGSMPAWILDSPIACLLSAAYPAPLVVHSLELLVLTTRRVAQAAQRGLHPERRHPTSAQVCTCSPGRWIPALARRPSRAWGGQEVHSTSKLPPPNPKLKKYQQGLTQYRTAPAEPNSNE
ncbi:hypothetical protein NDU88_005544 [Pleurodeles waltl]|uniref:Uncharacterized protein n=1 Tax=Pleurodeles waltl TaxID=8319 RepID=A0AAV7LPU0_PLEWA|nr:hypothetical protein NDU88_005544 [Pleurodeles waltl]